MEIQTRENQFQTISLSHKEAPISVRELLTFDENQTKAFLLYLKDLLDIQEAFLLSTCNRTEVYYFNSTDSTLVVKAIAAFKGIQATQIQKYFTILTESSDSIRHLFRVGIGLESQVLGDFQIINQVKNAYQWCADTQMAGPFLHKLLHTLFFANKKIVQETNFRSGSASVSYATKELVEELLLTDKNQSITIIGLGEIGLATARNLGENNFTNVTICNRTEAKVSPLIGEFGFQFKPLDEWAKTIKQSKLVISAISGEIVKIRKEDIENKQLFGFQYLIDLGLPRSIDTDVETVDGVVLYNLDQIQTRVNAALNLRMESIPYVEEILESAQIEFIEWTKEMQVFPVIHQIKNALEQIRQEEMSRFLKKANAQQALWADELTKNLMQRIMKNHVVELKAACKRGEADQLVDVLNQIFRIELAVES